MEKVVIIEYGAGNLFSVETAVRRLGYEVACSADADVIRAADKVIFPGVGQAAAAMRQLKEGGLDTVISSLRVPVLGICLGMQLMCEASDEGNTDGLGIFPIRVRKFGCKSKVPHMGWNGIRELRVRWLGGGTKGGRVYSCIPIMYPCVKIRLRRVIISGNLVPLSGRIISGDVNFIRRSLLKRGHEYLRTF